MLVLKRPWMEGQEQTRLDETVTLHQMTEFKSNDPLHGVTLERMLVELIDFYGWQELARRVKVRAFQDQPSVPSALKFLRKTPWAREKVEQLYLYMLRKHRH
ncbi:VF530 family DNA-binding protein [Deinococcus yavapaiensis]|uniref:Uncharacterized protein DUF2132 n=1 Tax=Deinococcus yavapaiensis KR-236 TaxID=694435 RepID=A0A318S6K5_9DEIO|nr:VF530 family protein [Deinococcus yavapaiensis]PYE53279.1 uncharacterized protein DUF2132 [Deinococcus yavapaiensis KR-236]